MSEKMREQFEEFIIQRDGAIWVSVMGESRSYNEPIERDFDMWRASRGTLVVELPEAYETDADGHWLIRRAEVKKIIEAQGLKVTP